MPVHAQLGRDTPTFLDEGRRPEGLSDDAAAFGQDGLGEVRVPRM